MDDLRTVVRRQWRAEERLRRVPDPAPIPVRWRTAASELGVHDHWINVGGGHHRPIREGGLDELGSLLRSLPSKRLVILGPPGSGKTTAVIRLLLEWTDRIEPTDPVPVLVSLGSWRPREIELLTWLVGQLITDYPTLTFPAGHGRTVARALVEDNRVLPILDGLDEIPAADHAVAIEKINAARHLGDPLVLTCRTDEYVRAVSHSDAVTAADVIELQPLRLHEISDYLIRTSRPRRDATTNWDAVLGRLRQRPADQPAAPILAALRTPLMTSLARAAYSDTGADPTELDRFTNAADVRAHLFDLAVPTAYLPAMPGSTWLMPRTHDWLTGLASRLDHAATYDLAWWRLADLGLSRLPVGLGTLAGALTALALTGLTVGAWPVVTMAMILGAGVGAYLGHRQPSVPSTVYWSLSGGVRRLRQFVGDLGQSIRRPAVTSVWWGGGLLVVGLAVGLRSGWPSALAGGAAVLCVRVLDAWFDVAVDPSRVPSPMALLRADRGATLLRAGLRAVVLGGVAAVLANGRVGASIAGAAVIASVGFTAWGRCTVIRAWLAVRGAVPWRLWSFLEDAAQRGLLRRIGGVYQFRHAQLQDRLAGRPVTGDDLEPPAVMEVAARPLNPDRFAPTDHVVVVLTALELEHEAVRRHLVDLRPVTHPSGTLFEVGWIPGCPRPIAVTALGEGNQTAAIVTDRSVALFHPDLILFVGIAGALHSDLALGDVVVATRVYFFQGGRDAEEGFLARPRAWDAPHHLEQRARYLNRTGEWLDRRGDPALPPPTVHFRPIAAGDVVMTAQDSTLARLIRSSYNDAAAVEMEGAGVARAAHLNAALPALILRGISDRADGDKGVLDGQGWQRVAAGNAAAFAVGLITALSVGA